MEQVLTSGLGLGGQGGGGDQHLLEGAQRQANAVVVHDSAGQGEEQEGGEEEADHAFMELQLLRCNFPSASIPAQLVAEYSASLLLSLDLY